MSVYLLADPRDGRARYVGRSVRPAIRLRKHLRAAHSRRLRDWIAELRAAGLVPEFRVLEGASEREWIIRLRPDLNVRDGRDDAEATGIGRVNFIEEADEIARWSARARAEGLPLSAWIRRACRLAAGTTQNEEKKGGK